MWKENILRKLLNEGKPTIGTHIIAPWPGMFEIIGNSGAFDYVEYVAEYSDWDLPMIANIGRTMELFPKMSLMIKVEEQAKGFLTTRAVDAGFQSVLFTDIRSAEALRESIRYIRVETLEDGGIHGSGNRRHSGGYGAERDTSKWPQHMREIVVVSMIEKPGAMEDLDAILDIEGLDMVQFGPGDYSVSIGMAGQGRSAQVQDKHKEMIEKALKKGVAPRVEIGTADQAEPYIKMGVKHFCMGWDVATMSAWCKNQGTALRGLVEKVFL